MVAVYHLIWSAYGCWLPNDPRGSSSHEIRNPTLAELAALNYGRKKVQPCSAEIRAFYRQAEPMLQHPVLRFDDEEVLLIAEAFATVVKRRGYTCYGCAIMFDHVHALIRTHRDKAEDMIHHLQVASRDRLLEAGHRETEHPTWGGPGWKVFLHTREDIERVVRYSAENPIKAGWPPQAWPFVQSYDGWLPGIGARRNR
jgi:REP element-mobilizing transposase RayT